MDADRADRLRRPAGAHRPAALAGSRPAWLDGRGALRGRQRGRLAAARTGVDADGDLLRLPGPWAARGGGRRAWLRGAGRGDDAGAVGAVPVLLAARLGAR